MKRDEDACCLEKTENEGVRKEACRGSGMSEMKGGLKRDGETCPVSRMEGMRDKGCRGMLCECLRFMFPLRSGAFFSIINKYISDTFMTLTY